MSSLRWSRFTHLVLLVCIAILLVASLDQVEAKKKKKKKSESTESVPAAAAAAAAASDVDANDIDISAALAAKKNKDKDKVHTQTDKDNSETATSTNSEVSSQGETETVSAGRIRRAKSAAVRAKRLEKRAKSAATRAARAQQQNQQISRSRRSRAEQVAAYHARQQAKLDRANKAKIAADHPDNRKKGQDKLNWMNKQAAASSTRVISVDADSFRHYVNEGPRPYRGILVFTSLLQQKPVCHQCHDAYSQYVPVSVAHHEHRKTMPTATTPALYFDPNNTQAQANEQNMPVFFVQVEASRSGNLFQTLKLSGVPSLMLVPPRPAPGGPDLKNFFSQVAPRQRFQLNQPRFEAAGFNTFINKHANILVNLDQKKVDMSDVLMGALILISAGVLIYFWLTGRIVLKIQRHSFVMLAWFMYMYCISGGMYNIIRGTQWASYEQGGKVSYIHPHFRDQHSSEGFMMGLLQLICGLMLTLLVARAFDSGDDTNTSTTSSTTSSSTSSSSSTAANVRSRRWHQHVATLILDLLSPTACVAIGVASWMQLTAVYRMKSHG